ncbi:MAG TPA: TonB-dependent receptor [Steroidobacteraceae bacterium]|nr:TonB-dependent receptor [Steroidobacteraceae bacterium]
MSINRISGKGSKAVAFAVRAILAAGLTSAAVAQNAPSEQEDTLQEVVVTTAQFREQNVQETPLAITAISAGMLEARSQTNITELTNQAPNVTLNAQGPTFGPSIAASIRGIGQVDFNPALEPGVGIYVDDVYYATLTGSMLDLLDLDRVEILRGPQGTLAGRNSIGGAVKLYSKKPKGDGSGYLAATYGSRDRVDLRGSTDFALADNLFARVAGVSKRQRGYIARRDYGCDFPNSGIPALRSAIAGCVIDYDSNVNLDAVRGALRWVATDALEINLAVDYTHDDRNPTGTVLVDGSPQVRPNVQPVPGATNIPLSTFVVPKGSYYNYAGYYSPPGTTTTGAPLLETRADPRQFFDGWGTSLQADWSLSDSLSLVSISAYREYDSGFSNDNDLSPLASSLGVGTLPFHSFSQELRLNGGFAGRFEYTLGAFYMDQQSRYESWQDLRYTGPLQFQQNDVVNADTQAAFAHLAYHMTDKLTVTGGLRYTEEHKDYTFVRRTRDGAPHPALGVLDGLKSNYDGNNLDYRIAGQYNWTDAVMTYLQFSTGFKGGGVSPRPFIPGQAVPFDPETLDSYELGVKSDWFDHALRVNTSVFFSKYEDLQLGLQTCPQFGGTGSPCGAWANAGDAEIKGLELESVIRPIDHLLIDASYSYIKFDYTSINPAVGGPTRPTGIQLNYRPPYMPTRKWSLGMQYEISLGERGTITPRIDMSYQGDLYTNGNNLATNRIASYTIGNARLTWRAPDEKWEAALELTNFTDEYYFLSRTDQYTGAGHSDGQPGRPREWGFTIRRNF